MSSEDRFKPFDPQVVRELAEILNETDLVEIEVRQDDLKLRLSRAAPAAAPMAAAAPAARAASTQPASAPAESGEPAEPDFESHPGAVKSPMVGTVYLRPSPDAELYFNEGDAVSEGDTVLLIEAMKTFNPIAAPKSGKIGRILVSDTQPVEFGEPLFTIE